MPVKCLDEARKQADKFKRQNLIDKFGNMLNNMDEGSCQCCYPPYCVQESQATYMPMCSPCMPCPPCMPCMPCMPKCADSGGFNPFPSEEEQRRRFIPYNRPEPPLITSDQVMEVRQTTDPGLAASGNSPGTKYNLVYDYFPPDKDQRQGARNRCGSNYSSKDRYKSRELRSSILLTGCDCKKSNGLQDDCRRRDCGIPECLTRPEPQCLPSGGPGPRKTGGVRGGGGVGGSNGSGGPSSYSRVVGQTIKQCPDCCVPILCTTVETSIPQPPPPPNMCYKFKLDDPPCVRDWCIPCKQHYKDCNEC